MARMLATLWKPPYRLDVTCAALKPGDNVFEIKVTNEWTNRQIGDRLEPVTSAVLAAAPGRGGGFAGRPGARGAATGPAATQGRGGLAGGRRGGGGGGGGGFGGAQVLSDAGLIGPVTLVAKTESK